MEDFLNELIDTTDTTDSTKISSSLSTPPDLGKVIYEPPYGPTIPDIESISVGNEQTVLDEQTALFDGWFNFGEQNCNGCKKG
jgi:hypothetical protein